MASETRIVRWVRAPILQFYSMNIILNSEHLNSVLFYVISKMDILIRPIGIIYQLIVLVNHTPLGFSNDS